MIDSLNFDIERSERKKDRAHKDMFTPIGFAVLWGLLALLCSMIGATIKYVSIIVPAIAVFAFVTSFLSYKKHSGIINESEDKMDRLIDAIVDWYNEYPQCPLGVEYCHPDILNTIYNLIRQGRAETIKEALNVFISDSHNAAMMRIAEETKFLADQSYKAMIDIKYR